MSARRDGFSVWLRGLDAGEIGFRVLDDVRHCLTITYDVSLWIRPDEADLDAVTAGLRALAEAASQMADALDPGPQVYEPASADEDEEEGRFRTRMACGDSLWDEEKYPEGAAMQCPRHGATTAITEAQWQAEHPPEPYGYILPEDYGRGQS